MLCRYPFLDCPGCDRCATPAIVIPPEHEPLRSKAAMLCFAGAMFAVLALGAFAIPNAFERVNSANQEDV